MIGISVVAQNYPLYCDAINEKVLGVAGLNFVGPCNYFPVDDSKKNIASFELIPYLLGNCQTIADVKKKMADANTSDESFNPNLPASELQWLIADQSGKVLY